MTTIRTERGWGGHFIGSDSCRFRRNTLLENGETKIVVSTVGLMLDPIRLGVGRAYCEIGYNRYFETMAFHAEHDGRYWDADVSREIHFDSPWAIADLDADDRANDMHETVVNEITARLDAGETFKEPTT